jgi:bacillolysin
MKLKKLLLSGLILIGVLIIYLTTLDKKIYYVALGDSLAVGQNPYGRIGYGYTDYISNYLENNELLEFYTKEFAKSNSKITDLVNDINNSKKIKINKQELSLKNALVKADLVTLSIGSTELYNKISVSSSLTADQKEDIYQYIDESVLQMDELLNLVRKYCNEDIILIGYYNPVSRFSSNYSRELEPIFLYCNEKMRQIAYKHNVHYVNIYDIFKENAEYIPNPSDIHPSTEGYEIIATQIINIIEKNILN